MKVMALGLRALPGIAGGVESHCEHLYPLIAEAGIDVEILVRSAYVAPSAPKQWRGTRIRRLWSPRKSGLEVILHTFLGVAYAAVHRPDVLHLHSVGPAIFAPLARALGLHVVVTHHAPDYVQAKWGWLGKWILKTGERMAMRYANEVISVSRHGAAELNRIYGRKPVLIPNGVPFIGPTESRVVLDELRLESGRYVLHVGRAIPDKRQDDLIKAFSRARLPGWKLVLVGNLSSNDEYSARVRQMAAERTDVVLAGFRSGVDLQTLFVNAGCFALPSAHRGTVDRVAGGPERRMRRRRQRHPGESRVELPAGCYFKVGDIDALAAAISTVSNTIPPQVRQKLRNRIHQEYDWSRIAEQTAQLYRDSTSGQLRHNGGTKGCRATSRHDNSVYRRRIGSPS